MKIISGIGSFKKVSRILARLAKTNPDFTTGQLAETCMKPDKPCRCSQCETQCLGYAE